MSNDPMDKIADQLNELSESSEMASPTGRSGGGVKDRNLDLILDIPLKVTVAPTTLGPTDPANLVGCCSC